MSAPILGYPNNRDEYTLTTDASLTGIGAVPTQQQEGIDRVISYASKTLNKSQKNYSATKRKLFAVVHFTNHFKTYLLGRKFSIVTDHRALVWLYSFKDPEGMVARWLEKLGQFDFEIKHKAGRSIPHADCLSRVLPEEEDPITVYVAALTENTTMEEHPANPWMLIQNTDRNSMQMKQHEDNNIKKVLKWIEEKQRPDRKNMNGASKEL